jgi:hypothetical protein
MQKTLIGKRAMDRDLVASTPSRGARRRIRREVLAATKKVKPAFVPRPNYRPPVVVKLKRARNAFLPGSVGHLNAVIVGQLRVAREIAARGPRTAVKTGYGDRKRRRKLRSGLADTSRGGCTTGCSRRRRARRSAPRRRLRLAARASTRSSAGSSGSRTR